MKLTRRKNIEIDKDILDWLEKEHEGLSIWWLVNSLLRNFMNLYPKNPLRKFSRIAAKRTLKEL